MIRPQEVIGALTAASGAGSILLLDAIGQNTLGIQLYGTFTATVVVEGTIDGTNWVTLNLIPYNTSAPVTSLTTTGVWFANVSGFKTVRARCTAYTSSPKIAMVADDSAGAAASQALGTFPTVDVRAVVRSDQWTDQSAAAGEDASGAAGVVVKAKVASVKQNITYAKITATAACSVWLEDEDGNIALSKTPLAANQTIIFNLGLNPKPTTANNKDLEIHSSTSDVIHWDVFGYNA